MSSTTQKMILLVVAAGIVLGGGIAFYGGVSGWGILGGIVLGIFGAAVGASTLVGHIPLAKEIEWPREKGPSQ